mgnify:CR=1 FL=1
MLKDQVATVIQGDFKYESIKSCEYHRPSIELVKYILNRSQKKNDAVKSIKNPEHQAPG